jgi:hypothetical protein
MKKFFLWWILAFGLGLSPIVLSGPLQDKAEKIVQDYENGRISEQEAEKQLSKIRQNIESNSPKIILAGPPESEPTMQAPPPGSYWLARNSGFLSGLVTFVLWAIGIGAVGWFTLGLYLHSRNTSNTSPPGGIFGNTSAVPRTPSYTPPPVMRDSSPNIRPPQNLSGQYARQGQVNGRHSGEISPDLV